MVRALSVITLLFVCLSSAAAERGVRPLPSRRLAGRPRLSVDAPVKVRRQVSYVSDGVVEVLNTSLWARRLARRASLLPRDAHAFLPTELPGNLVDVRFDKDGRTAVAVEYFPYYEPTGAQTHAALVDKALASSQLVMPSERAEVRRAVAQAEPVRFHLGARTGDFEIIGQLLEDSFSFIKISRRIAPGNEFRSNTGWFSPRFTIANETPPL